MPSRIGLLFVLSVPVAASLAHANEVHVGGMSYTGFLWLLSLGAAMFVILSENTAVSGARVPMPYLLWGLWIGWLALSSLWRDTHDLRGLQDVLQIGMPVLIAVVSSMFVRSERDLELLLRVFCWTLPVLMAQAIAARLGLLGDEQEQGNRVLALNAALVGCVFAAKFPRQRLVPLLGWGGCLAVTAVTGSRTATAVLLIVPIFHPGYRSLLVRTALVGCLLAAAVGLFYTQTFQERFFASGSGTLEDLVNGDVLDYGRLEVWPYVWREALERPWMGAGVGSAYNFVPTVWPEMFHIHNDYLRIFFETGAIGLALFTLAAGAQLYDLFTPSRRQSGQQREVASAALLGLIIFLLSSTTDNTLIYNLAYMNPLFALIGAFYGAREGATAPAPRSQFVPFAGRSLSSNQFPLPPDHPYRRGMRS